jgi:hypothetical protein
MFSFVTRSYLSYIRGVDYKGLNGSVISAIIDISYAHTKESKRNNLQAHGYR